MTARTIMMALTAILLGPAVARAEPPPGDGAIPAEIVRTVSAPATQPMRMPTAVAVDSRGRLFVADGVNRRIVCFDAQGRFQQAATAPGDQPLIRPVGLFCDRKDRLWIADSGGRRIVMAPADGGPGESFPVPTTQGDRPANPTGLAVTADGRRLYVVDGVNHRLMIRDIRTGQWTLLGRRGSGLGQFQWPFAVAVDGEGRAYVSEVVGARVQRVSPDDRWAGQVGRWGIEPGQFYRTKGVAVSSRGRLYVSDSTLGVVQAFDARGQFEGVLADRQGKPLRFRHPMGLCLDEAGLLYVTELAGDDVAVVRLLPADAKQPAAPGPEGPPGGADSGPPDSGRSCAVCHLQWMDAYGRPGAKTLIDKPDNLAVADSDTCLGCHDGSVGDSRERVWVNAGHRTGIVPPAGIKVPAILPLSGGKVTCRTCHTAHTGGGDRESIAKRGDPLANAIFMRVPNDSGQLCTQCHRAEAAGTKGGSHPIGPAKQPVPPALIAMGASGGPDGRQLNCQTCHTAHGGRESPLLIAGALDNRLCGNCHSFPAGGQGRHPCPVRLTQQAQREAITAMSTRAGPGQALICLSCHKMHKGVGERFLLADSLADGALCIRCHPKSATVVGSAHDLRPKPGDGATSLTAGGGVCLSCHGVHQARAPEPLAKGGRLDPAGRCADCHRKGGAAEKRADIPFAHPVTFVSPAPIDRAGENADAGTPGRGDAEKRSENNVPASSLAIDRRRPLSGAGKLVLTPDLSDPTGTGKSLACLSCHDPHAAGRKAFLRLGPDELCGQCHPDLTSRLSGKHDFRDRPDMTNRFAKPAAATGRCGFCHSVHRGIGPILNAATTQPTESPDDWCRQCHRPTGLAAKSAAAPYTHPTGPRPGEAGLRPGEAGRAAAARGSQTADLRGSTLPLFDAKGFRTADGSVSCASCHDPHGDSRNCASLVRNDRANWELCANCHPGQVMLIGGSHDATRAGAEADTKKVWPAGAPRKDLCLSCHAAHGKDPDRKLWTFTPVAAAGPDDGVCLGCHPKSDWLTAEGNLAVGAALHLRAVPDPRRPGKMPLVTTAPDRPADRIGCKTCHNPHASAKANRLLRTSGGSETSAVCLGCHPAARQTDSTMHAPRVVSKEGEKALERLPVCGPCHAVHAVKGSTREMLWAAGGPEDVRPSEKRWLTCHGPAGTAVRPDTPTHRPLPTGLLTDIGLKTVHEDAKGVSPLTCIVCHTPHGFSFSAAVPVLAPPSSREYATKPLLRPGVARDLCASCHGYDGLRKFLYYHRRSNRDRLRF